MSSLITGLLAIPAVRLFLEDVIMRLISEVLFKADKDPEFRRAFLSLSAQLAGAQNEDAKRAILVQLRDLRHR